MGGLDEFQRYRQFAGAGLEQDRVAPQAQEPATVRVFAANRQRRRYEHQLALETFVIGGRQQWTFDSNRLYFERVGLGFRFERAVDAGRDAFA